MIRLRTIFVLLGGAALIALFAACGGAPSTPTPPGSVSGNVTLGAFDSNAGQASASAWQPHGDQDYRPGEIIVRFGDGVSSQALPTLRVAGSELLYRRALSLSKTHLYRVAGADTTDLRDPRTLDIAQQLNARSDVRYAQPNYILRALQTRTPNDTTYAQQWHYEAINLPQAWNVTTGSENVVVAVIDTGMMFDATTAANTHPDLVGKVVGDYDFISDPGIAGDGDGRDGNGYDLLGDNHGSHVGGTVSAATDNNTGIAGVGWDTSLLNVRVLGNGGGTLTDITDGSLWAAGIAVGGVPNNPTPAQVLNLSLGGEGVCSPFEQDGYDRIRQAGAIVVVAAGNENEDAATKSPSSCAGVITVGATGPTGDRSSFSNYGTRVDVMAPGGDGGGGDNNGDGTPDGILSTVRNADGSPGYDWFDGTSMASPHVAGVVALMVAQRPGLTPDEALSVLRATARPLSAAQCARPAGSDCGAGLIDAFAALQALGSPPPPTGGVLRFDPDPLAFSTDATPDDPQQIQLGFTNTSDATVTWQLQGFTASGGNPGAVPAGALAAAAGTPTSGTLAANATAQIDVVLDRSQLSEAGAYSATMDFDVDGTGQTLLVRFNVAPDAPPTETLTEYMDVLAVAFDDTAPDGFRVLGSQVNQDGFLTSFDFEVEPSSEVYLDAWYDANGNGEFDEGDLAGYFPEDPDQVFAITSGQETSGIELRMWPVTDADAAERRQRGRR